MSTNHTTNYNLNQWEATDKVLRTDFNEDNAKIDAALKASADVAAAAAAAAALCGNCQIETQSYTGTGTHGAASPTRITFSKPPLLFIIVSNLYAVAFGSSFLNNCVVAYTNSIGNCTATWSGNTVALSSDSFANTQMNGENRIYQVIAFTAKE